jgi:hypothetical protein
VNQSLDAQGQMAALDGAFALHTLAHANNKIIFGEIADPSGAETIRREMRKS